MNILGLHFGHDAAAAVLRNGQVQVCVLRERQRRIKHAVSLDIHTIETALAACALTPRDIDFCAITSTQGIELIIDDPRRAAINLTPHPSHQIPSPLLDLLRTSNINLNSLLRQDFLPTFYRPEYANSFRFKHFRHFFPEHQGRSISDFAWTPWLDSYCGHNSWKPRTLAEIAAADFREALNDDRLRLGYHLPVAFSLDGHAIPASFIHHHMAHAGSSFFQSPFSDAAIFSHDGHGDGSGDLSGFFCIGRGNRILPMTPHHLAIGTLYEMLGVWLNLGDYGSEGKLMGLSAYGNPRFFDRSYVGNWFDSQRSHRSPETWSNHCLQSARSAGYNMSSLGQRQQMTDPLNADIAASTQKLFEETYLAATEALAQAQQRAGVASPNLCLTGGCALNCPSNSRIAREGPFPNLFVEPGCDDSGLAIGAALYLYHTLLDQPRIPRSPDWHASPYIGPPIPHDSLASALERHKSELHAENCQDPAHAAALDLQANRVIGWFEGRSELGPRALGHRSVLANPTVGSNWQRVNKIKSREPWRPFAPAVLASEAAQWFRGSPLPSPYMLFNATVRSDRVPAITHADGSSRIQTVHAGDGRFFQLLEHFFALTGIPLVLNTSFNGPGEPIVEQPDDAIRFLLSTALDALYIEGHRITRLPPH